MPGLDFVCGNAENLPFADQSFDAVINIEASAYYPQFPRFLAEVARVLRPGGHFLYADVRPRDQIAKWEEELGNSPMRLMSERVISDEIARGLETNTPRMKESNVRLLPGSMVDKSFVEDLPQPAKRRDLLPDVLLRQRLRRIAGRNLVPGGDPINSHRGNRPDLAGAHHCDSPPSPISQHA